MAESRSRIGHVTPVLTSDWLARDVIEALEGACQYDTFIEYGITDHGDQHRLKGPGMDPDVGTGGVR